MYKISCTGSRLLDEIIAKDLYNNIEQLFIMSELGKFKTLMSILIKAERELHLQNSPNDKGNGFRIRKLNTSIEQI